MAISSLPLFGVVLLVAFISTDFLSLFFANKNNVPKNKKVQEKKSTTSQERNDNEEFQFASEDDDYYDSEFDPGSLEDDEVDDDIFNSIPDDVVDGDDLDSATPKKTYNNDLGQVPDDGSMDGILSKEEQIIEEQSTFATYQDEQFDPSQKEEVKKENSEEFDILDFLTNPSSIFESPPYDVTTLSRNNRVHISFCTSWSYKGGFHQLKNHIDDRYDGVKVIGTNYPVPTGKMILARIVIGLILIGILTSLLGKKILEWCGITNPPEFVTTMTNNKLTSCMFIWFVGNLVTSGLTSTGAFEIAYNGQMVFSKLETGHMPMLDAVIKNIENLRA